MASAPSPDIFGFLSGYNERRREIEAQNMALAQQNAAREAEILKLLLGSPDAKIRSLAATGLLTSAGGPKLKSGIQGWMGQMENNPVFPEVLRYMQTPQVTGYEETFVPTSLPSVQRFPTLAGVQALPSTPTQTPPAALPDTQTTTPGATPPATPQIVPAPLPAPGAPVPGAVLTPPPTLDTPEGQAGLAAVAQMAPPPGMAPGPEVLTLDSQTGALRPPGAPSFAQTAEPIAVPPQAPPPPPGPLFNEVAVPGTWDVQRGAPIYGLPQAFPTPEQTLIAQQRGQALGEIGGTIEAYTAMFRAILPPGPDREVEARKKAAQLYAAEKQRAISMSGLGGGTYFNRALFELGYSYADVQADPAKAQEANDLALQFQGEAAGATTVGRGLAAQGIPLNPVQRTARAASERMRWQTIRAPIRTMELAMREMTDLWQRYAKGDMTAAEPLRTLFVRMSEPNSVVMPSEFVRSAGIGSVVDRLYGQALQWVQGGLTLPPYMVANMVRSAMAIWEGAQDYASVERSAIMAAITNPMVNIRPVEVFGDEGLVYRPDPFGTAPPPPEQPSPEQPPPGGGPPAPPARLTPGGRTLQRTPSGWQTSRPGATLAPTGPSRSRQRADGTWEIVWD